MMRHAYWIICAFLSVVCGVLLFGASGCATVPAPSLVPYSEPVHRDTVFVLDTMPLPWPQYQSVVEITQLNDVGMPMHSWRDTVDRYNECIQSMQRVGQAVRQYPKSRFMIVEIERIRR